MRFLQTDGWTDERSLEQALALASAAAAFASPNPTVGCVLVREGALLGEGAHRYAERDHAEIVAIKRARAAGHDLRNATAFVTLEPCSHHGRTSPCADALIAQGIRRCVVATVDPNPLVRGQGVARLRAAGIEVDLLPADRAFAQQARRLNDAFAFAIQEGRPFVTLKSALSVDGYLAPPETARRERAPFWLTGAAARESVGELRHGADTLLTGIGTVLADDPQLTDRSGLPRGRPLLRVVLDSTLRLPLGSRLVREAAGDLLVVCSQGAEGDRRRALERFALEVVSLPASSHEERLLAVLQLLQARQQRSVLAEGGSGLNAALLRAELVEKVVLFFAQVELGKGALPFAADHTSPFALQQRLRKVSQLTFPHAPGEDTRVDGYLHDPWAAVP